ncbi:unnamed protein product [Cyprideis torosa]|uniref:Uncharacterized protein n=1 Tax=Cyprideis torosa TaxID=163714 RepID=A0A7R8ZN72_9CRUS|nr:unnamed protein product [Cyprideis torosa]CAG0887208.1 unnamed protein product [Cyprideis torosa]
MSPIPRVLWEGSSDSTSSSALPCPAMRPTRKSRVRRNLVAKAEHKQQKLNSIDVVTQFNRVTGDDLLVGEQSRRAYPICLVGFVQSRREEMERFDDNNVLFPRFESVLKPAIMGGTSGPLAAMLEEYRIEGLDVESALDSFYNLPLKKPVKPTAQSFADVHQLPPALLALAKEGRSGAPASTAGGSGKRRNNPASVRSLSILDALTELGSGEMATLSQAVHPSKATPLRGTREPPSRSQPLQHDFLSVHQARAGRTAIAASSLYSSVQAQTKRRQSQPGQRNGSVPSAKDSVSEVYGVPFRVNGSTGASVVSPSEIDAIVKQVLASSSSPSLQTPPPDMGRRKGMSLFPSPVRQTPPTAPSPAASAPIKKKKSPALLPRPPPPPLSPAWSPGPSGAFPGVRRTPEWTRAVFEIARKGDAPKLGSSTFEGDVVWHSPPTDRGFSLRQKEADEELSTV